VLFCVLQLTKLQNILKRCCRWLAETPLVYFTGFLYVTWQQHEDLCLWLNCCYFLCCCILLVTISFLFSFNTFSKCFHFWPRFGRPELAETATCVCVSVAVDSTWEWDESTSTTLAAGTVEGSVTGLELTLPLIMSSICETYIAVSGWTTLTSLAASTAFWSVKRESL